MNFQTMSKQRKFILIAAVVGIISIFLPWISLSFLGSQNGFRSYGIVVFLAFAGAGILSLLGDQSKPLDQAMWLVEIVAGIVALLFTIIFLMSIKQPFISPDPGFGIWISLLASLGVLASAWLFRNPSDSFKGGFDSLKKSIPAGSMPSRSTTTTTTTTAGTNSNATSSSKIAELEKLIEMKNRGEITEDEYQQLKSKLI